jgi:hypothetical protein
MARSLKHLRRFPEKWPSAGSKNRLRAPLQPEKSGCLATGQRRGRTTPFADLEFGFPAWENGFPYKEIDFPGWDCGIPYQDKANPGWDREYPGWETHFPG